MKKLSLSQLKALAHESIPMFHNRYHLSWMGPKLKLGQHKREFKRVIKKMIKLSWVCVPVHPQDLCTFGWVFDSIKQPHFVHFSPQQQCHSPSSCRPECTTRLGGHTGSASAPVSTEDIQSSSCLCSHQWYTICKHCLYWARKLFSYSECWNFIWTVP